MESARQVYADVTGDEDFVTVLGITDSMPSIANECLMFGRNECGNQNLHSWIERLTTATTPVTVG